MSTGQVAAFICYALAALLSLVFGAIYLVRSQFMPYHEEAVGIPWQQLDPRSRPCCWASYAWPAVDS